MVKKHECKDCKFFQSIYICCRGLVKRCVFDYTNNTNGDCYTFRIKEKEK